VIIPDDVAWAVRGHDLAAHGLVAAGPENAQVLVLPADVPSALAEAVAAIRSRIPRDARVMVLKTGALLEPGAKGANVAGPVHGTDGDAPHGGHGQHGSHGHHDDHGAHGEGDHGNGEHDGHDEHDHEDMMAIVGEPSADGLVMEPIEMEFGPLSGVLPGGLVLAVQLDGDVVSACKLHATLRGVDQLAPVASRPPAEPWAAIEAVEHERAVSHLAWLRSLGRLLGWAQLVDAAQRALTALLATPRRVTDATGPAADVTGLIETRRFRQRAAGHGHVPGSAGLPGPNGRADGADNDARTRDPHYEQLGFTAITTDGADVCARALVRAREAQEAVRVALAAQSRPPDGDGAVAIEGPRGAVGLSGAPAREAAAAAAIGQEWSAALLVVASFDLSPWERAA